MAHAAIAFAKASRRKRMMACTTSIGPGALNMVTAAALAHVNRLPVLLIPGDVFANRIPDPVLQEVEDFGDGTVSANDCFRPVSRYFDRIMRPEQIVPTLNRAVAVLTDPADCGPVTLAFCQDVQAEAYDYPTSFFEERVHRIRRTTPDVRDVADAAGLLRSAKKPLVILGGGVLYSEAEAELIDFCTRRGIPVGETQAGKSAMPVDHPLAMGAIGVTGTAAANALAAEADVIVGVGTRFADFTTGSWALFKNSERRWSGSTSSRSMRRSTAPLPLWATPRRRLRGSTRRLATGRRLALGPRRPPRVRPTGRRPQLATPRPPMRRCRRTRKCSER